MGDRHDLPRPRRSTQGRPLQFSPKAASVDARSTASGSFFGAEVVDVLDDEGRQRGNLVRVAVYDVQLVLTYVAVIRERDVRGIGEQALPGIVVRARRRRRRNEKRRVADDAANADRK